MRNLLPIDVNGLGYAAMYQPELAKLSFNGESTAGLHGALISVFTYMKNFPGYTPIVLWDGKAQWRHDLFPEYKAGRTDTPEKLEIRASYKRQIPHIRRLLSAAGIPQLIHPDLEADDLAGLLCRGSAGEDIQITMGTKDTDWFQALDTHVSWHSNFKQVTVTMDDLNSERVEDGPFPTPDFYIRCKALAGDVSDGIDGIPKVGLKTAAKILREYGSFEALWQRFDEGEVPKGKIMQSVAGKDFRELYQRNLRLMDWRLAPPVEIDRLTPLYSPADLNEVRAICAEFNMKSVATMIHNRGQLADFDDDVAFAVNAIELEMQEMLANFEQPEIEKPARKVWRF